MPRLQQVRVLAPTGSKSRDTLSHRKTNFQVWNNYVMFIFKLNQVMYNVIRLQK